MSKLKKKREKVKRIKSQKKKSFLIHKCCQSSNSSKSVNARTGKA